MQKNTSTDNNRNNKYTYQLTNISRRKFVSTSVLLTGGLLFGTKSLLHASNSFMGNINNHSDMENQSKTHKCKITVLKREYYQELADEYLANPKAGKCSLFKEGQEFIVDRSNYFSMLDGKFCGEAWDAISRYVYAAIQGGSIMRGWTNDEKIMITCCNDGVRPVIFKLERIDE